MNKYWLMTKEEALKYIERKGYQIIKDVKVEDGLGHFHILDRNMSEAKIPYKEEMKNADKGE